MYVRVVQMLCPPPPTCRELQEEELRQHDAGTQSTHTCIHTHTHTDRERERERSIRRNVYMEVEEDKKRAVLMEFMSFNGHLLLLLTLSTHFSLSMQIRPKKKLK